MLSHKYFLDFKDFQVYRSIHPGSNRGDPEVNDIRAIKYNPNDFNIEFKLLFDDPYCVLPQRIKKILTKVNIDTYNPLYSKPIDLTLSKWNDLQKLKNELLVSFIL